MPGCSRPTSRTTDARSRRSRPPGQVGRAQERKRRVLEAVAVHVHPHEREGRPRISAVAPSVFAEHGSAHVQETASQVRPGRSTATSTRTGVGARATPVTMSNRPTASAKSRTPRARQRPRVSRSPDATTSSPGGVRTVTPKFALGEVHVSQPMAEGGSVCQPERGSQASSGKNVASRASPSPPYRRALWSSGAVVARTSTSGRSVPRRAACERMRVVGFGRVAAAGPVDVQLRDRQPRATCARNGWFAQRRNTSLSVAWLRRGESDDELRRVPSRRPLSMRTDNVLGELDGGARMASSAEHTNGVWAGAVDPVMIDPTTTVATASRVRTPSVLHRERPKISLAVHGLIFASFRDYLVTEHGVEVANDVTAGEPQYTLGEAHRRAPRARRACRARTAVSRGAPVRIRSLHGGDDLARSVLVPSEPRRRRAISADGRDADP